MKNIELNICCWDLTTLTTKLYPIILKAILSSEIVRRQQKSSLIEKKDCKKVFDSIKLTSFQQKHHSIIKHGFDIKPN